MVVVGGSLERQKERKKKKKSEEEKGSLEKGGLYMKTLEGQFCKYTRGGSNKIRDRPAPGIRAIYVTRNRLVTSTGRGIPTWVGVGRSKIAIPS